MSSPGVNPRLQFSSVAARRGGIATGSRSRGNNTEWPAAAVGLDSWFENESSVSAHEEGLNVLPARDCHYKEAVEALESSEVIAVPTDTLYGLACDACSADAIQRIYEIKARKLSSPLAVCVADVEDVSSYSETSHLPSGLLGELLPGAVTLLLPRGESTLLSPSLNPGVASIGIRIPDSEFIRGVSRSFGGALALTSANISSHLSTIRVEEFEHLWPQCGYVFNAGVLPGGRSGSTIVDLTQKGSYKVIRSGSVLQETIQVLDKFGLRGV